EAEDLLKKREGLRNEVKRYRTLHKRVEEMTSLLKQKKIADLMNYVDPELRKSESVQRFLGLIGIGLALIEFKEARAESIEIEKERATVRVYTETQRSTKEGSVTEARTDEWDFVEKEGVWYLSPQKRQPKMPKHPK
ncbi:MAG: hypothetical protein N2234_03180, partial [Planctomycetota bacterium]|nr:hypothetical protein [Planctomycetota bacterium]